MKLQKIARLSVAGVVGGALTLGVAGPASASAATTAPPSRAQDTVTVDNEKLPLTTRVAAQKRLAPGATQVAPNVLSWNSGRVVMTLPATGQRTAAPSSSGVLALQQAAYGEVAPATTDSLGDCPTVTFGNDYYCFYADQYFGGRRLQFKDGNQTIYFQSYGFENQCDSWVNGGGKNPKIYQSNKSYLFTASAHSNATQLGSAANKNWYFVVS